jgi:hypothetical protein
MTHEHHSTIITDLVGKIEAETVTCVTAAHDREPE